MARVQNIREVVDINDCEFTEIEGANFIDARQTKLEVKNSHFLKSGDNTLLGGAIFWQGKDLLIFNTEF